MYVEPWSEYKAVQEPSSQLLWRAFRTYLRLKIHDSGSRTAIDLCQICFRFVLWGQGSEMGIDDMINLDTFWIRFRHRWSLKIFRCDRDSFGLLPLLSLSGCMKRLNGLQFSNYTCTSSLSFIPSLSIGSVNCQLTGQSYTQRIPQ